MAASSQKNIDWREYRRLRAWELFQQGWTQAHIAEAFGVTQGAISQWMKLAKDGGKEALRRRKAPGPTAKLSAEQCAQLPALLSRGAEAFGFAGNVWTTERIAEVIRREWQVVYSRAHIGKILKACKWSYQKPELRALQRNEEAIQKWRDEHWPALHRAEEAGSTILFIDEAGFYLLPSIVRTWSPMGQTPILKNKATRDHLSVIGALTSTGDFYMQAQEKVFNSQGIVAFLIYLLKEVAGQLVIVWDGIPIHRSNAVKRFLAEGASERLVLKLLPSYAPELNPVDGIWRYLKRIELKNVCCQNLTDLQRELTAAQECLRRKPEIIRACLAEVGYFEQVKDKHSERSPI